jgi:hypothetical protein
MKGSATSALTNAVTGSASATGSATGNRIRNSPVPITSGETEIDSAASVSTHPRPRAAKSAMGNASADGRAVEHKRHEDRPQRRRPDSGGQAQDRDHTLQQHRHKRKHQERPRPKDRRAVDQTAPETVSPGHAIGGRSSPVPMSPPAHQASASSPAAAQIATCTGPASPRGPGRTRTGTPGRSPAPPSWRAARRRGSGPRQNLSCRSGR